MQRISVTTIEKFRRYMNDVSPYDTEQALIQCIRNEFLGTQQTMFGGAYHKILEAQYTTVADAVHVQNDGCKFIFTGAQAMPAISFCFDHPLMAHEVPVNKIYETAYGPLQVSGRVDGLEGSAVHDSKCKFRPPQWQEYIDSCQWRFYLDMMDVDVFYYDLFEVRFFKDFIGTKPYVVEDTVNIIPHEPMRCERYKDAEKELVTLLNGFMDYLHARHLINELKPALLVNELNF